MFGFYCRDCLFAKLGTLIDGFASPSFLYDVTMVDMKHDQLLGSGSSC